MNLLRLPWLAANPRLRWLGLGLSMIVLVAAVGLIAHHGQASSWLLVSLLVGLGLAYLWAFLFSSSLLLAIDAHVWRMPRAQREITASLWLYGLLSVVLPSLALHASGAPAVAVVGMLALFCAGGLCMSLLPRYFAIGFAMLPSLGAGLFRSLGLPPPGQPGFLSWALPLLVLTLGFVGWRWRRLVRGDHVAVQGMRGPIALQLRNGNWGDWNQLGAASRLRQMPNWLQPEPDLRQAGPHKPVTALRVMLGGWYLPQTARGYLRQLTPCLLVPLAVMVVAVLSRLSDHELGSDFARGLLLGMLGSLLALAGPITTLLTWQLLTQRWRRTGGELALLGTLPGLSGSKLHGHLLRAALGMPLLLHACWLLVSLAVCLLGGASHDLLGWLALNQLGCAAMTVVFALDILAGCRIPKGIAAVVTVVTLILGYSSASLTRGEWAGDLTTAIRWSIGLGWLLLALTMCWLGRRSWLDLRRRAHPFLANTR